MRGVPFDVTRFAHCALFAVLASAHYVESFSLAFGALAIGNVGMPFPEDVALTIAGFARRTLRAVIAVRVGKVVMVLVFAGVDITTGAVAWVALAASVAG